MVKNPFIFSKEEEETVGRKDVLEKLNKKLREEKAPLVFFSGKVGSGRTFFINKLRDKLAEEPGIDLEALTLTSRAIKDLEQIPKKEREGEVIFAIDMFERTKDLDEEAQEEVIELIKKRHEAGIGLILIVTPKMIEFLGENYSTFHNRGGVIKLRSLNLEEAKKLIKLRLDRVDRNFPDIFSKKEFKKIWKEADGNPRTILMTCASLFEKKVESSETPKIEVEE